MIPAIRARRLARKAIRPVLLLAVSLSLCAAPAAARQPTYYLNDAPLSFTLPAVPTNPGMIELELTIVRAVHTVSGSAAADEVIVDAKAFPAEDLMGRFSDSAQTPLSPTARPLLLRLMMRAMGELSNYSDDYKKKGDRQRPYIEDPSIALCYDNPSYPLNSKQSYPSGHAANGYGAALILAEMFPARRQQVLARGVRYGENRIACEAHHPSDVLQGQLLAIEFFKEIALSDRFKRDLDCARSEDAVILKKQVSVPASCTAPSA
jgi:acid phosphatase (class A)